MNYETAAKKYLELRDECDRVETAAKKQVAELKKLMTDIENWITLRADEEGLKTVPTPYGTAYWSTHYSATTGNPEVFRSFALDGHLDLLETRPSKAAVKAYVEGHGAPPPGINFSSYRVFNLRASKKEM